MLPLHNRAVLGLLMFFAMTLVPTRIEASNDQGVEQLGGGGAPQRHTTVQPGGALHDSVAALARALADTSAPMGLLALTINTLGQTNARVVERSGAILDIKFDHRGGFVAQRLVADVKTLPVLAQVYVGTVDVARVVRDPSGSLIYVVIDPADRVLTIGIVRPPTASATGEGVAPVRGSAPAVVVPGASTHDAVETSLPSTPLGMRPAGL